MRIIPSNGLVHIRDFSQGDGMLLLNGFHLSWRENMRFIAGNW
jgi:hypothetical protein